jgi:hypothetical protein
VRRSGLRRSSLVPGLAPVLAVPVLVPVLVAVLVPVLAVPVLVPGLVGTPCRARVRVVPDSLLWSDLVTIGSRTVRHGGAGGSEQDQQEGEHQQAEKSGAPARDSAARASGGPRGHPARIGTSRPRLSRLAP